jgi:hypothetical protein
MGVSTVNAARRSVDGHIHTYEAGVEMVNILDDTVARNNVTDRVTVHHAVVATAERIEGRMSDANHISPTNLPSCNVLVMDCEGAETTIIPQLENRPPEIIVETHGNREMVEAQLKNQGYTIESAAVAEQPPLEDTLRKNGVYVLSATYPYGDRAE